MEAVDIDSEEVLPTDFEFDQVVADDVARERFSDSVKRKTYEGYEILHVGPYGKLGAFAMFRRMKPESQQRLEAAHKRNQDAAMNAYRIMNQQLQEKAEKEAAAGSLKEES